MNDGQNKIVVDAIQRLGTLATRDAEARDSLRNHPMRDSLISPEEWSRSEWTGETIALGLSALRMVADELGIEVPARTVIHVE